MNKRLIAGAIILLGLILISPFVYDHNLNKDEGNRIPGYLSSYPDIGYFKIDPHTILESLGRAETNIFMPLLEDPSSVESLTNVSFFWTQADFLKIVSALGILIWDDPMKLRDWSIYDYYFERSCHDGPDGFDYGDITYFKTIVVNGKKVYTTRHIEIDPYFSMVRWGSGATYPQPILHKWNGFNLAEANITAEGALRISEEHGGEEARLKVNNQCLIIISPSKNNDKWFVNYVSTDFSTLIDPYTGEYEIFSTSQ